MKSYLDYDYDIRIHVFGETAFASAHLNDMQQRRLNEPGFTVNGRDCLDNPRKHVPMSDADFVKFNGLDQ